jgi:very-short-patch-repair endonuclease
LRVARVLRHDELARDGREIAALRKLVRLGKVERVGYGTYALPGTPGALVLAARFRAKVDCVSAVHLHGVAVLESPERIHLAVCDERSGSAHPAAERSRVHLHRATDISASSPVVAGPVRPPAAALARFVTCGERAGVLVALDSAVNRRLVSVEDVAARVRGHGRARGMALLALVDGRSQSVIETLARLALRDAGLSVEPQAKISGVGRVDLLVEGKVVVELDGFAYHGDRAAYREDRRRDRSVVAHGLVVLRFTYEDVVRDPGCVVRAVARALAAHARR